MDDILKFLPGRPRSVALRIAIATGLVGLCFVLVLGMRREGLLGFYILLPAVFLVSVLFDRGSGIYAAVLSTILLYAMLTPPGSALLPSQYIIPLAGFLLIALLLAIGSEALRSALERAAAAEQAKDLLLRELAHRTKNNLMIVISILSMQARVKANPETRQALQEAVARIEAIAGAHEHVQAVQHKGEVEMRAYLHKLCGHLADALRDVRSVAVKVDVPELYLPTERAIPVGLIVNELVTNSLKHAFPDGKEGMIEVVLRQHSMLTLLIRDDGVGCSREITEGMGTRLVRLLAQQLGAKIAWEHPTVGCQVRVELANS